MSGQAPEKSKEVRAKKEDVMKVQIRLAVLFAGFLLTTVAALAGVTTDYDHNVDFTHYKTYSWGKVQTANGLWDDSVKNAVASQLAAKGFSEGPQAGGGGAPARAAIT